MCQQGFTSSYTQKTEFAFKAFLVDVGLAKNLILFWGIFAVGMCALFFSCFLALLMSHFVSIETASLSLIILLGLGALYLVCSEQKIDSKIVQPIINRFRPHIFLSNNRIIEVRDEIKISLSSIILVVLLPPPRLHLS
jgi:hypothetical protein